MSLATISASTESLSRYDWCPDASFIIYEIEVTNFLFLRNMLSISQEHEINIALLFYPNCIGGINLSTLLNRTIRGYG